MRYLKNPVVAIVVAVGILFILTNVLSRTGSNVTQANAAVSSYQQRYDTNSSYVHPRASDGKHCKEHVYTYGDEDGAEESCIHALQRESSKALAILEAKLGHEDPGADGTLADGLFYDDTLRVVNKVRRLLKMEQNGIANSAYWNRMHQVLGAQTVPSGSYTDPKNKVDKVSRAPKNSDDAVEDKGDYTPAPEKSESKSSSDEPKTSCNGGPWWVTCTKEQQGVG